MPKLPDKLPQAIYSFPCDSDSVVHHTLERRLSLRSQAPAIQRGRQVDANGLPLAKEFRGSGSRLRALLSHLLEKGDEELRAVIFLYIFERRAEE